MSKESASPGERLSQPLAEAIGRLTVNFNWMENSVEVLIRAIVSPRGSGLADPLITPMPFRAKLECTKKLIKLLEEHFVPTPENEDLYTLLKAQLEALISQAQQLNTFRNKLIHWRPFLLEERDSHTPEITADTDTIEAKSKEMFNVGLDLFVHAIRLRKADYSLNL